MLTSGPAVSSTAHAHPRLPRRRAISFYRLPLLLQRKKKAYTSLKPTAPDYTVKLTAAAQAVDKGEKTLQVSLAPPAAER
jgi:hypothetical protein